MAERPVRVPWGAGIVEAVVRELARGRCVAVSLPANFHHSISQCFERDDLGHRVDITGDAELLRLVARIRSLNAFAGLCDPIAHAKAQVRVTSPAPEVFFMPAPQPTPQAPHRHGEPQRVTTATICRHSAAPT